MTTEEILEEMKPLTLELDYADEAAAGVWKTFEAYRKDPDSYLLVDAEQGLQTLLGAVDALRERS